MLIPSGKNILTGISLLLLGSGALNAQYRDYPIQPVPFTKVQLSDAFWEPKVKVNAEVTIPYLLEMCKTHGRIDNFLRAAKNSAAIKPLCSLLTIPMCTKPLKGHRTVCR